MSISTSFSSQHTFSQVKKHHQNPNINSYQLPYQEAPRFSSPQFGRRNNETLVTLGAAAIILIPLLGLFGLVRSFNPPASSQQVGQVETIIGLNYTVDSNNQVMNPLGIAIGSFDNDGNAFDSFKRMVGYTDVNGRIFQNKTINGVMTTVPVGSITEDGTIHGGSLLSDGSTLHLPGLTRQQKGAVFLLTLPR
jgi:hypothetical protein